MLGVLRSSSELSISTMQHKRLKRAALQSCHFPDTDTVSGRHLNTEAVCPHWPLGMRYYA